MMGTNQVTLGVLIVAKCIVNEMTENDLKAAVESINSSKVYCKWY